MSNEVQIVNLLNLYGLAIDTQRWDLFDLVFTQDAEAIYPGGGHWRDLASFKRDFAAIHDPLAATQHVITNHQVTFDGDRANAMCYGTWRLVRDVTQGGGNVWTGGGYYDDILIRTPQGWRISKRVARVLWWEGNPLVGMIQAGKDLDDMQTAFRREAEAGKVDYIEALINTGR